MKSKGILFLLLAAIVASAAFILLQKRGADAPAARIIRDGVLLEEINLDKVDKPYSFTLEDKSGWNTVQVEQGRIRISEADCPDQVCVNQGWIADGTVPVICLPHKLVIKIINGGDDVDGGAG